MKVPPVLSSPWLRVAIDAKARTAQGDGIGAVFELVGEIWTESTARLASLPALASFLSERRVSIPHYIQLLNEQEGAGEPLVVIDARKQLSCHGPLRHCPNFGVGPLPFSICHG